MEVSVDEGRDRLTQLLNAVENGEQVTITRHGQPIADLIRTSARKRRAPKFGTLAGLGIVANPNWHKGPQTIEEVEAWLKGGFK